MNLFEAGVIAGMPAGAVIGGALARPDGTPAMLGGAFAGLVVGAVSGWLYALGVMALLAVAGVLWRAARKREDGLPTEAELKAATSVAVRGIFLGAVSAPVCLLALGWAYAVAAPLAVALVTAFFAVARGGPRS